MSMQTEHFCKFPESKSEARVAIARDVIKQVKRGLYQPLTDNGYVILRPVVTKVSNLEEATSGCCQVCALGSMLLSSFNLFGDERAFAVAASRLPGLIGSSDIEHQLESIFDQRELRKMESVFENYYGEDSYLTDIGNDAERLVAMMQNIIDNGGDFKPELEPAS